LLKNLQKVACFSTAKNTMQFTTIYHAIHHNFTTTKHRFSHKPPEKTPFHHAQKKCGPAKSRTASFEN